MASLRGGVDKYDALSPPGIEADVDAVFGSWAVGAGENAGLFGAKAVVSGIGNKGIASMAAGFRRTIRKGAGGRGPVIGRAEVGSLDGNGREGRRESGIKGERVRLGDEEWERESSWRGGRGGRTGASSLGILSGLSTG